MVERMFESTNYAHKYCQALARPQRWVSSRGSGDVTLGLEQDESGVDFTASHFWAQWKGNREQHPTSPFSAISSQSTGI
jgi:hypothetical protein